MMEQSTQRIPGAKKSVLLRSAAVDVLKKLESAGHTAYFAGGCVRDRLMGHEPLDYDIATDARPEQVAKVFPKVQTVGESFGVMIVRRSGYMIQVATFRTDDAYSDGRRPDSVTFTDAQHDACRRDFTVNGLFEDPLNDKIIDYVNGQADLKANIIRAIGDPHDRLREDRLRTLRAVRFAARFGFRIEDDTAQAVRDAADDLRGVSRERIGHELRRMLIDQNRTEAVRLIEHLGLDCAVLLEDHSSTDQARLPKLPEVVHFPTACAAWLLDRHSKNTEIDLIPIARKWSDALVLSNEERFGIRHAIDVYQTVQSKWSGMEVAAQKRLAASEGFDQGLLLVQLTNETVYEGIKKRVDELAKTGLAPDPLVTGSDLLEIGLNQGPEFGKVLGDVYDAQLEGRVLNRADALKLAKSLSVSIQAEIGEV